MTKDEEIKRLNEKIEFLERFAALVASAEREACAKICEHQVSTHGWAQANIAASAIRARGQA